MDVDRKLGDRLNIKLLAVGRQRVQTHVLLESNLKVAWDRVVRSSDPRMRLPIFKEEGEGWSAYSPLTGEKLADIFLTPPPRGRRSP